MEPLTGTAVSLGGSLIEKLLGGVFKGDNTPQRQEYVAKLQGCPPPDWILSGPGVDNGTEFPNMPFPNPTEPFKKEKIYANKFFWAANYNRHANVRAAAQPCVDAYVKAITDATKNAGAPQQGNVQPAGTLASPEIQSALRLLRDTLFVGGATTQPSMGSPTGQERGTGDFPWGYAVAAGIAGIGLVIAVIWVTKS